MFRISSLPSQWQQDLRSIVALQGGQEWFGQIHGAWGTGGHSIREGKRSPEFWCCTTRSFHCALGWNWMEPCTFNKTYDIRKKNHADFPWVKRLYMYKMCLPMNIYLSLSLHISIYILEKGRWIDRNRVCICVWSYVKFMFLFVYYHVRQTTPACSTRVGNYMS